jgi:RNA polymerase sigma-70 factor (ECF subfamily)
LEHAAPSDDLSVSTLVQRAADGDAESFGALYDQYVSRVYRFVRYRVRTVQETEDLTEEIFMKVWRALPEYRASQVPFAAWLFRVARNHVIDHHRTSRPTDSLETAGLSADGPERDALRILEGSEVRSMLELLTADQRQILEMRFFHDMTTAEIAQATERNEGAVRALQMRALSALRRALQQRGASRGD